MKCFVREPGSDVVLQEAPTFRAACKWLLEVQDSLPGFVYEIVTQKKTTRRRQHPVVVEAVFELDGADLV